LALSNQSVLRKDKKRGKRNVVQVEWEGEK